MSADSGSRRFLFLGLGLLASLAACSGGDGDTVRIGAALPLSGKHANVGGFFRDGYQLAVEEVNALGGVEIDGVRRPIELRVYDDKSDASISPSLLERLIAVDGAVALLSGYSTPLVQAQVIVPMRRGIPFMNAGGASKSIFREGNEWVFGALSPVEALASTTLEWLAWEQDQDRLPRPLKVAMVWQNTDHGREYRTGVQQVMEQEADRFDLVLDESFEHLSSDHTSLIVKVRSVEADVFLSDAHEPDFLLQHRAYVEQGLGHVAVSYGARGPERSVREGLGEAVSHLISAQWWTRALPYQRSRHFVEQYEAKFGGPVTEYYPAVAYEAARALIAAIGNANSTAPEAIRDALRNLELTDSLLPGERLYFPEESRYQIENRCVIVQNQPEGGVRIIFPPEAAEGPAFLGL
jgi:branched-chain amino acid transport system substrate-binding protein